MEASASRNKIYLGIISNLIGIICHRLSTRVLCTSVLTGIWNNRTSLWVEVYRSTPVAAPCVRRCEKAIVRYSIVRHSIFRRGIPLCRPQYTTCYRTPCILHANDEKSTTWSVIHAVDSWDVNLHGGDVNVRVCSRYFGR